MLDLIGQRYGKLPSEILESGDTLDMIISITALEYEVWREKKRSNGQTPTHHSVEELQSRIDRANEISGQK
jgi:hypothetical protein